MARLLLTVIGIPTCAFGGQADRVPEGGPDRGTRPGRARPHGGLGGRRRGGRRRFAPARGDPSLLPRGPAGGGCLAYYPQLGAGGFWPPTGSRWSLPPWPGAPLKQARWPPASVAPWRSRWPPRPGTPFGARSGYAWRWRRARPTRRSVVGGGRPNRSAGHSDRGRAGEPDATGGG